MNDIILAQSGQENTALTKTKIDTSLRRGFCSQTKPDDDDMLPPADFLEAHRARTKAMRKRRLELYEKLGKPNKLNVMKWKGKEKESRFDTAVIKEYFDIGDALHEIDLKNRKIKDSVRLNLDFPVIFFGVAETLLDKETFEEISKKARMLEGSGFTGSKKEWVEFSKTL